MLDLITKFYYRKSRKTEKGGGGKEKSHIIDLNNNIKQLIKVCILMKGKNERS